MKTSMILPVILGAFLFPTIGQSATIEFKNVKDIQTEPTEGKTRYANFTSSTFGKIRGDICPATWLPGGDTMKTLSFAEKHNLPVDVTIYARSSDSGYTYCFLGATVLAD